MGGAGAGAVGPPQTPLAIRSRTPSSASGSRTRSGVGGRRHLLALAIGSDYVIGLGQGEFDVEVVSIHRLNRRASAR